MNQLEQNARTAAIKFRNNEIDSNALARAIYPLLKKISGYAAYNIRMDVEDDIFNSVWLAFQTKGILQWDESKSIGAYLSAIARNAAVMLWREEDPYAIAQINKEGEEVNTTEDVEYSASSSSASNNPYDSVEKIIAIGAIREKLLYASRSHGSEAINEQENDVKSQTTLMPGARAGTLLPPSEPQVKPKSSRKAYVLNKDQAELAEIYRRMHEDNGMTQEDFAKKIDIGTARLASYLYGRTASVPEHIMDAARLLIKSPEHIESKFDKMEMPAILLKWAKALGMKTVDDAKLAPLIGVSVATVCRWRNKETRPSNVKLITYDAAVQALSERLNKVAA